MALPEHLKSEPITRKQAEDYVNEYLPLKQVLITKVLPRISAQELNEVSFAEAKKFFSSEINAFIFTKETVMRFFDAAQNEGQTAQYLMVLLAAKYDGADKGAPTIVVAGVNETEGKEDSYTSLNIEYPATEQPPTQVNCSFPGPQNLAGTNQIEFTLA
jgi:hypothetical protein